MVFEERVVAPVFHASVFNTSIFKLGPCRETMWSLPRHGGALRLVLLVVIMFLPHGIWPAVAKRLGVDK